MHVFALERPSHPARFPRKLTDCLEIMPRPKRQEDPLLPVPLPRRRPSRANTRNLVSAVKPELAQKIKSLADVEQTSVAALIEEASINLLRSRGIEYPDYLRHYQRDAVG